MVGSKVAPNFYHAATRHSFRSVQMDPNYVDASTQPTSFKRYPKFYRRFPLDLSQSIHSFLYHTSAITFQKMYREGAHALRVNPSAGALFPTEIYVQLRGISGLLDGIYHFEIETNSLTLIYELIDDGLEGYLTDSRLIKGCLFVVSCVYFRSSWKYKNRSLRYCFLDAGHHLGAIAASAYAHDRAVELLFDFDQAAINDELGFETKEFATAMVISGTRKAKLIRRLRSPLPVVSGTDYFEPNRFVEEGYQHTLTASTLCVLPPASSPSPVCLDQARFLQAIQTRRSARRFQPDAIPKEAWLTVQTVLQEAIPAHHAENLAVYTVVQAVAAVEPGLYLADRPLKLGNFREQMGYLCVNQAIARDAAVVFFFVAEAQNYRIALQLAGFLGQRIYLTATYLHLGCSGIGAFFDDETQTFLETEGCVLYAVAIGYDPALDSIPTHEKSFPLPG
ncbi:MAG: nitroreductase family protein [Leptolyngbyaceae cyanobacterium bins.349]|nr:nitroreductase family protein [Leptolyngbyaceae cyanobacterium bins.349]